VKVLQRRQTCTSVPMHIVNDFEFVCNFLYGGIQHISCQQGLELWEGTMYGRVMGIVADSGIELSAMGLLLHPAPPTTHGETICHSRGPRYAKGIPGPPKPRYAQKICYPQNHKIYENIHRPSICRATSNIIFFHGAFSVP
jgi:hypothetical protein